MVTFENLGLHWLLPNLIHFGAVCYLVCFLFRNQLWLRLFAIMGDAVYTGYYFTAADVPLWSAIAYSSLNMAINLIMIGLIMQDRRMLPLDDNDLRLFQSFGGMTPGDFRRMRRIGKWRKAQQDEVLTVEGMALNKLYYVVDGALVMTKGTKQVDLNPGVFIGEIAYLKNGPASATVTAKAGSTYICWNHDELRGMANRQSTLDHSLATLLMDDLARKVARS